MRDSAGKLATFDALADEDHQLTFSLRPLLNSIFSPSVLRLSLTGVLFVVASISLAGSSVAAYAAFYYSYIPHPGFSRPLYMQYDVLAPSEIQQLPLQTHSTTEATTSIRAMAHTSFPYAVVPLMPGDVVPSQPYAIKVHLVLPRTPTNLQAGNFMLDLTLFQASVPEVDSHLLRARRPALLTYRTYIHETLRRLISLPLLLLNLRSESEALSVTMFEHLTLPRGSQMPSALRLEIQSPLPLQVTDARISFKAEYRGLRKLMRNHRIFSAILFSTSFFAVAESVLVLFCLVLGVRIVQHGKAAKRGAETGEIEDVKAVKVEPGAEADDEREDDIAAELGSDVIKKEEEDESVWVRDADPGFDSGIGTSMDSSGGATRRRTSGKDRD